MPRLVAKILCVAVGSASLLSGCGHRSASPGHAAYAATRKAAKKLSVIGFWAHSQSGPVSLVAANSKDVSVLSPLWYSLDGSGNLRPKVDQSLLSIARQKHISITPLVSDATGTQAFLTSSVTRKRAVQAIDQMVRSMHFQGVNLDFEPPHTRVQSELTAFVTELRDTLPKSESITMDIVPHSGGAYDYQHLTPNLNGYIVMSYDQHSQGTIEGPVAALNWVESVEARLVKKVPASKLYLGVALYGYSWPSGSTNAATVPSSQIPAAVKAKATWNARAQEMTAMVGGDTYWWENSRGLAQKIALAKRDHLAGIAAWQLGYADASIYRQLRSAMD